MMENGVSGVTGLSAWESRPETDVVTLVADLETAWSLIKDEKDWCQRAEARDVHGASVSPADDAACRFCARGAVFRVTLRGITEDREAAKDLYHRYDDMIRLLGEVAMTRLHAECVDSVLDHTPVIFVNDRMDHASVGKMFTTAIRTAKDALGAE